MNTLYGIEDVAAMSGLSVRTIRGYLAGGVLKGEKVDGVWRFTPEQFGDFLSQEQVRRSVRSKRTGAVADFLGASRRKAPAACLIWDWPVSGGEEERRLYSALEERANALGLRWSYRYENGIPGHSGGWAGGYRGAPERAGIGEAPDQDGPGLRFA